MSYRIPCLPPIITIGNKLVSHNQATKTVFAEKFWQKYGRVAHDGEDGFVVIILFS